MRTETVVVTASAGSYPGLAEALGKLAVSVEEYPLLNFRPPSDWLPVDLALDQLGSYDAVVLTSPRAAAALADRIAYRGDPTSRLGHPPSVWAAGSATASALHGALGPVRTPTAEQSGRVGAAEALAIAMIDAQVTGRVLFPCGDSRREELPDRLRREGIEVEEVVCYQQLLASESDACAAAGRGTVLVVASPSVANLLIRACSPDSRPDLIAAGPTTAASARASGWSPAAVALQPTVEAVTAAVREVLARRSPP